MRRVLLIVLTLITFAPFINTERAQAAPVNDAAIYRTWALADQPVADGSVHRTWMWGPSAIWDGLLEPYADAPGGRRLVQYFDKSRMEITQPGNDPNAAWYVTNGLLAQELVTGKMQLGDHAFQQYPPSEMGVAGDDTDTDGPSYRTFKGLLNVGPLPTDTIITQTVNRAGQVSADAKLREQDVSVRDVGAPTNHTVASVFWDFMMHSGYDNPFYTTGYPLTEAYWTTVRVDRKPTLVLAQVFERRVLTYTPSNPDGWKVEAGNVGMHYFIWRYITLGGGFTFCSTLGPPAYVSSWWRNPQATAVDALGFYPTASSPFRSIYDNAEMLRNAYHLVTAEDGCYNEDTSLFDRWMMMYASAAKSAAGSTTMLEDACSKMKTQFNIALRQPESLVGQKIRMIERGQDPLRPERGPDAYTKYLVGPALAMTTCRGPLRARELAAWYPDLITKYQIAKINNPAGTPDFGAFLLAEGFDIGS